MPGSDAAYSAVMGREPGSDSTQIDTMIDGSSRRVYATVAGIPDVWVRSSETVEEVLFNFNINNNQNGKLTQWMHAQQRKIYEERSYHLRRAAHPHVSNARELEVVPEARRRTLGIGMMDLTGQVAMRRMKS